jgi:hypothetical protein
VLHLRDRRAHHVLDVLREIVDAMMKMGGLMAKMGVKKDDHLKVAKVDHR